LGVEDVEVGQMVCLREPGRSRKGQGLCAASQIR
jgi:hypothetical protein